MTQDYTQMTEAQLREIKRTKSSRSPEFLAARKELNRRAAQDPRNVYPIGGKSWEEIGNPYERKA